ncbi:hypothetical protein E2I00_019040 [Balaenoptera physalus]|uniref:Zona pellucida protein C n=1 Tax=Balaenoptera physalus TaxID=9770 RepID=A0A6A1Q999_BALPH|nr:hypothetical protein E2I00_019040 [Balaenoptera physalus]
MTPHTLVYAIILHYNSLPANSSGIWRTNPTVIPIKCSYTRRRSVSSKAIQPTWIPFSSTLSSQQRLKCTMRLMTESWSSERNSTSFQLRDVIHIQTDVHTGSHVALRLSIDSYVAMRTPNTESTP